jgi:hypothetical protein
VSPTAAINQSIAPIATHMLFAETVERESGAPRMDWMSPFPTRPTTNPARYTIPTTLAVVLNVFIFSPSVILLFLSDFAI